MNPRFGVTMGDLNVETKRWNRRVQQCGYTLKTIWECEWEEQVKENLEIKQHVQRCAVDNPIEPRSALYGGRTETFRLHARGSEEVPIKYVDVVSQFFSLSH